MSWCHYRDTLKGKQEKVAIAAYHVEDLVGIGGGVWGTWIQELLLEWGRV